MKFNWSVKRIAALFVLVSLSSCASIRMDPLKKEDYASLVIATLQREQLASPETIFLHLSEFDAAEVAPLVQKRLSGVTVKTKMDDLKEGGMAGCDSDKVTKAPALTLSFGPPELNPGRVTFLIGFRTCSMDAHSDNYTFHNLGQGWDIEDIRPGSMSS